MQMSDVPLSLILTLLTLILFERFAKNLHQQPHAAEFLTPPPRQTCRKTYIFCRCFFFIFLNLYIFNGRLSRPGGSEPNGPIFIKISGLIDGCKGLFTSLSFLIFQGTLPGQPIKGENRHFPGPIYFIALPLGNELQYGNSDFKNVQYNEFLYVVYNFSSIRSRNLRVYAVNDSIFCGDTAKIEISRKISHNILDLS